MGRSVLRLSANFKAVRKSVEISVLGTALAVAVFALNSCSYLKSPEKKVAEKRRVVSADFQKELAHQLSPGVKGEIELTWNQALEHMYMHNPTLLNADFKSEDALAEKRRIFTDFIPGLSVGASDSFQLGEFDDAFSDINYRVYSYLPLGQLVSLPKNIYKQKLFYIGSELQAEHTMRQEVIALYRLFQQQYLLNLEGLAVQLESELSRGLVGLEDAEAVRLREDSAKSYQEWQERQEEWRVKVGDFFMNDYERITLLRRHLPKITYRADELDFADTRRWGMLQLNLLALEQIAEDARLLQAYLRYLPRPNFNVTAPSLYNETNGFGFDADNIRVGPSVNWSLDTRGAISRQLNRIKREKPLSDWRKDKRRREEIKKLLDGKKALIEVQKELRETEEVMKGYRTLVKEGLVSDPEKAVRTMRSLRQKQVALAAKEIEICTSFWLIDETRWTATTKRWQQTRKLRAEKRKLAYEADKKARKAAKKAAKKKN